MLALASFFYIYTIGSYFKINIYILQNRVTYNTFFDFYIISKYADHVIIISTIVAWLALSLRGKAKFLAPSILGGITVTALVTNSHLLLDITALVSIPVAISFVVYDRLISKKGKRILIYNDNNNNIATNLFINYLAIIGLAIV